MRKFVQTSAREAAKHPGMMPVVSLGSVDEHSSTFGDIPAPRLVTLDWHQFGDHAAPCGGSDFVPPTLPASSAPALAPPDSGGNNVIDITPQAKKASVSDDMDDEIPF